MSKTDEGAATIEFVFLGILVLVPLFYLVLAVESVQRAAFGVTQAAREAGRAYATADDPASADRQAHYAARLALSDQSLDADRAEIRYAARNSNCATPITPSLEPGDEFEVCVVYRASFPGVPGFLDGGRNTVRGRYLVHIDDLRSS